MFGLGTSLSFFALPLSDFIALGTQVDSRSELDVTGMTTFRKNVSCTHPVRDVELGACLEVSPANVSSSESSLFLCMQVIFNIISSFIFTAFRLLSPLRRAHAHVYR